MKPEEARQLVKKLFPAYDQSPNLFNLICEVYLQGRLDQAAEELTRDLRSFQR
jgi:hypothetical protein